jgi:hypothetical protein
MAVSGFFWLQEWIDKGFVDILIRFHKNMMAWFQGLVDFRRQKTDSRINVDDIEWLRRGKGRLESPDHIV